MSTNNIRARCLTILGSFLINPGELEKVNNGASLLDFSSLDSLSMVNLVVQLEIEFTVRLDADELDTVLSTLDSLTDYLEKNSSGQA
jgi:acyl carrier protein